MSHHYKYKLLLFVTLFVIGVIFRVLPHTPNVTPLTAIALFGGAFFSIRYALILPLLIFVTSDLFLGLHSAIGYTWGALLLTAILGLYLLKGKVRAPRVLGVTLLSSILFYAITNFGVWAEGIMYPLTFGGLMQSYTMAIPFFRNSLIGDLFYAGAFFGSYLVITSVVSRYSTYFISNKA